MIRHKPNKLVLTMVLLSLLFLSGYFNYRYILNITNPQLEKIILERNQFYEMDQGIYAQNYNINFIKNPKWLSSFLVIVLNVAIQSFILWIWVDKKKIVHYFAALNSTLVLLGAILTLMSYYVNSSVLYSISLNIRDMIKFSVLLALFLILGPVVKSIPND